jgi:hypothetical protein
MIWLLIKTWAELTRWGNPITIDQDFGLYDFHVVENNDYKNSNKTDKNNPFHITSHKSACEMKIKMAIANTNTM